MAWWIAFLWGATAGSVKMVVWISIVVTIAVYIAYSYVIGWIFRQGREIGRNERTEEQE
jgi:hypothetical protein